MLAVENPANGQRITTVPDAGPADVDKAVRAAVGAWPAWRVTDRHAALMSCAAVVEEAAPVLAPVLTEEQGKPLREAEAEFTRAAARFRYFAGLRIEPRVVGQAEVHRRPLGPVAAITPWNFPVQLAVAKLAPAFAAGNTVVLKPSPHTPLTTLHLGRMLAEVLPPGVLTVLTGQDPLGEHLVTHPGIRKINFTGSVATGKHVAAAAAADLKRLTLELGGNDPAIILPCADTALLAEKLFWSAFANCGQICMAIKRVYAVGSAYDGVVEALAALATEVVVGDGRTPGTRIGPVNNRPQYDRVIGLTEEARSDGARLVTGGRLDGPGYFFAPAILAEAHDGMRVVTEEQFGPVLPIVRCSTVDEAVGLANATKFGLCGSVWGTDEERAADVAMRLEGGTVWVNEHLAMSLDEPFAGSKWSGLGVSGGVWGIEGNTEPFVVHRPAGAR
ncbi:aldehyde dehydrogenase [Amycolatopsis thailandensis]|uniref:Aldehyde dehydrogenase n=1 Tax=Amycolatopsis thailandensis TaxID=589330 RepID=A0A229S6V6_9PSEU|nr:aldehyde dehydrogenase family protein [Amycolatopsis thailandensis]OXM54667.1 aldehyde dehydrogenase [Amycolatopsis thailandensis]